MKSTMLAAAFAAILSFFGAHQSILPARLINPPPIVAMQGAGSPAHKADRQVASAIVAVAKPDSTPTAPERAAAMTNHTAPVTQTVIYKYVMEPGAVSSQSLASSGLTESVLDARLQEITNALRLELYGRMSNTASAPIATGGVWNAIAASNKIDQLTGISITNATVNGVSGLTDADIPDGINASNYLPLTGGTITGALSITDGGATSTATLGTERVTDGDFATDPSSSWTLGSGWTWDSANSRVSHAAGTGAISVGNTQSGINSPTAISSISIDSGGTGYTSGDIITISGGSGDATYTVTASAGKVTALTQVSPGTAYTSGTGVSTTGGTGTGLKITINQIAYVAPLTQIITTSDSDPTTSYTSNISYTTISGVTYKVTFTIANYSGSGSVRADIGSATSLMYPYPTYLYKSNGTYTILLTSTSSTLTFTPTADFAGDITNVSVKPVIPSAAIISVNNTTGSTPFEIHTSSLADNLFIGTGAGQNNTAGGLPPDDGHNTGVGYRALFANTTGGSNTANGAYALFSNTIGTGNTATGFESLYSNTTGVNNSVLGVSALWQNTTGNSNVAIGSVALHYNTTGSYNIAVGAASMFYNTTGIQNTAIGGNTMLRNTTGTSNTAVGFQSLQSNTTGANNIAIGVLSMLNNTTGSNNTVSGYQALRFNTTGSNNTAFGRLTLTNATTTANNTVMGYQAMQGSTVGSYTISGTNNAAFGYEAFKNYIDGSSNAAFGYQAMVNATTSKNSVAVGYLAGQGASTNDNYQGLVALGYQTGLALANGSDYNTLIGYQAGNKITTGARNILIGAIPTTANANITTGSGNIVIGYNISATSSTATNSLNVGNLLFGFGLDGAATTLSTGNIGIASSTPWARFSIAGANGGTVPLFAISSSTSGGVASSAFFVNSNGLVGMGTSSPTTALQVNGSITPNADNVFYDGNATYRWAAVYAANGTIQTSDERLKGDIATTTYGLDQIMQLRPVSYIWKAQPEQGTHLGFIAQEVQRILPETVNIGDDANRTLGLKYTEFIPPIVRAIQQLFAMVSDLAMNLTTKELVATNGTFDSVSAKTIHGDNVTGNQLCAGSTCINEVQLQAMLVATGQTGPAGSSGAAPSSTAADVPPRPSEPPVITIAGENPAHIHVGDTYSDLGALAKDTAGHDLSVKTFLNGALVSDIVLDTSAAETDTIDYVATDGAGNTATSTRPVIIEAPEASPASPPTTDTSTTTATSTP